MKVSLNSWEKDGLASKSFCASRKLRHGSPVIYWKNQGGDLSSEDLTRTS